MLYRERPEMEKVKSTTVEASNTSPQVNEEFVECLKNALKIMEARQ